MRRVARVLIGLAASMTAISGVNAQTAPMDQEEVRISVDSGLVESSGGERGVIFSTVVPVPDASWLRLTFDKVVLGDSPRDGEPSVLKITSLRDGASQTLDATALFQWRYTSAYFNSDILLIELIADGGAQPSQVASTLVWAGPRDPEIFGSRSICGPTDDRELSDDPRGARVVPIGCSVWLINDINHCFLTAGHCISSSTEIVEFNVPMSTSGGGLQHPGPEDQYPLDDSSIQTNYGQGTGDDWAYFGCFPNSETGLTPYETQGDFYVLAMPPAVDGNNIRITGYGTTSYPVDPTWNQVQKTHVGPFVTSSGSLVQYQTDTTGGNSGSPVIHEETGNAIGIHTHGGCDSGGGQNSGTGVNHAELQYALAHPKGVCIPNLPIGFEFPDGLPDWLHPDGDSIRVVVVGIDDGVPEPGTGMLHYDIGDGYVSIPMVELYDNTYDAVFPAIDCRTIVEYYFSAESTEGDYVTEPLLAPASMFNALVIVDIDFAFADNFETDLGWTVEDDDYITTGSWDRGIPGAYGRGDPPTDADGSGRCYLTGNSSQEDIDDGTTLLISPVMDAAVDSPVIAYWRWYSNIEGSTPYTDTFYVNVSDDAGASWTPLETVGPTGPEVEGGWYYKEFVIADYVDLTDQFMIKFEAGDLGEGSVVEAAVDGVEIRTYFCGDLEGDVNGDGVVDVVDLIALLAAWGPCPDCPEDINGDGIVNVVDLLILLSNWT